MLGQPMWIALGDKAIAIGVGAGEDAQLADTLKAPTGDTGRTGRMHLSGAMYMTWLQLMEAKADSLSATAAALGKSDDPSIDAADSSPEDATQIAADAARSKAQFAAMKAQAARVNSIDAETHVEADGMVITSQTTLK